MVSAMKRPQPMPVFSSLASIPKDSSKMRSSGLLDSKEHRLPILSLTDWIALGHFGKWSTLPRNSSGKIFGS